MARWRKYQRDPSPPRMRLTPRDVEVLLTLGELGLATREHLQALFFPSRETASRRLRLLFQHGYVERRVYPPRLLDWTAPEPLPAEAWGSPPLLYELTKAGWQVVADALGEEEARTRQARLPELRSPLFLAHRLGVLDLRVALLGAAAQAPGEALQSWYEEREAQQSWPVGAGDREEWETLRPDGLFIYRIGEQVLLSFVEVDRGSERGAKLSQKLARYVAYGRTDWFYQWTGRKNYRVLFLVPAAERRAYWQAQLDGVTTKAAERGRFWVGLPEGVSPAGLRAAVWQRGDEPTQRPFLPPPERS